MTDTSPVSAAIRDTGAGLRDNRSALLEAMAAEGELGRARQAAANERATARQEAMVSQAAQRAAVIGAPEQLTDELAAMQAARNFNLDSNRAYMDAAYERALDSIYGRNDRYIEAIGEGAVLQANRLDAELAAAKQLLDAQAAEAARRAAASRGGGGGGGGSSMADFLAQLQTQQQGNSLTDAAVRANLYDSLPGAMGDPQFQAMMDEAEAMSNAGVPLTTRELQALADKYDQGWQNTNIASQYFIGASAAAPPSVSIEAAMAALDAELNRGGDPREYGMVVPSHIQDLSTYGPR